MQSFCCCVNTQRVLKTPQDLSRLGDLFTLSALLSFFHLLSTLPPETLRSFLLLLSTNRFFFSSLFFLMLFLLLFPPFLLFSLPQNSPPFHLFFEGSEVLSLAVCFKGAHVPTLAVFIKGPWVLALAVFLFFFFFLTKEPKTFPFTTLPLQHLLPHLWDVDLVSLIKVFFAHPLLYLTYLLLRLHQAHTESEEDQAPNYSLECLHCTRLTPTNADWPCLAIVSLHCFFFLLLFLASALVPLPFPFGTFVQRSQFHSLPRR